MQAAYAVMNSTIRLSPIMDDAGLNALRALFSRPPNDWCWCIAWEVGPGGEAWALRTQTQNAALRERLWAEGRRPFYLITSEDAPCGWIKAGPLQTWPVLCGRIGLDPLPDDWAVTCVGLDPAWRRRGVMRAAMAQLPGAVRAAGCRRLFGFPRRPEDSPEAGQAWMGPYSLFQDLGFERVGAGSGREIFRLDLNT